MYDDLPQEGLLLDEQVSFNSKEFCQLCGISRESLIEMVKEGLLEPINQEMQWRFSAATLRRARIALHLQRDLGINLAGIMTVLDLLQEVRELRQRVRCLEYQLYD